MSTIKPRINITVDKKLYNTINVLAKRDSCSLSKEAKSLIINAIELFEDSYWIEKASKREQSFNNKSALSHDEVWEE